MKNEIELFENVAAMIDSLRGEAVEENFTSDLDKEALERLTDDLNTAVARFYGRGTISKKTPAQIEDDLGNGLALLSGLEEDLMSGKVPLAAFPVYAELAERVLAAVDCACKKLNRLNGGTENAD